MDDAPDRLKKKIKNKNEVEIIIRTTGKQLLRYYVATVVTRGVDAGM